MVTEPALERSTSNVELSERERILGDIARFYDLHTNSSGGPGVIADSIVEEKMSKANISSGELRAERLTRDALLRYIRKHLRDGSFSNAERTARERLGIELADPISELRPAVIQAAGRLFLNNQKALDEERQAFVSEYAFSDEELHSAAEYAVRLSLLERYPYQLDMVRTIVAKFHLPKEFLCEVVKELLVRELKHQPLQYIPSLKDFLSDPDLRSVVTSSSIAALASEKLRQAQEVGVGEDHLKRFREFFLL